MEEIIESKQFEFCLPLSLSTYLKNLFLENYSTKPDLTDSKSGKKSQFRNLIKYEICCSIFEIIEKLSREINVQIWN